jgi:putative NADH-flavin reductase
MEKIIVFGASGATGSQFVQQALESGHEVTAIIRDPARFSRPDHPNLIIHKGDVMQPESFAGAMKDKDAVISALGNRSTKPTRLYSTGMKNIIAAMQVNNIQRIICLSAGALDTNPKMGLLIRLLTKLVLQRILREPYADMRFMEAEIRHTNLDYTIIRPPMLRHKPMKGKYRVAVNGHLARPFSIARADLAHYMLHHIADSGIFRSTVEISY